MAHIYIIRGLPGSGKSTFARKLASATGAYHVEADMYFIRSDGQYDFRREMLKAAHAWCQDMAATAISAGEDVIVSNTFTQRWEVEPYLKMGAEAVTIITCEGDYGNIHGVPDAAIARMRERWERF